MTTSEETASKNRILSLKARWNKTVSDGDETLAQQMLHRLRTDCKTLNENRPLKLDLSGITLLNEDLSGLDLSGYDLSHASLTRCDLTGTVLSYSNCQHTGLEQAILDECEFIGSELMSARLNECSAKRCGFGGADLSHASMIHADLTEATLSHSTLIHADLRASNLKKARLTEADLSHAIFTRASVVEGDLKHSTVEGTNFELADMRGCRLLGIKGFKKASWVGADIRDLDLRGAYMVRRYIADENYLFEFQKSSKMHRMIYLIWWASSDCGRSLSRWFVWLVLATLAFAGCYSMLDMDFGDHPTVFSPVYFSFVTLTTLGYGDAVPASIAGQIIVTLQAMTGYMGLGGLLSILGNKMARRAE